MRVFVRAVRMLRPFLAWTHALLFCSLMAHTVPAAERVRSPERSAPAPASMASPRWPRGTIATRFENLEGVILVQGTLGGIGPRDTTGPLVLDTGAGYLGLDAALARGLGIADAAEVGSLDAGSIGIASRPLPRLSLGELEIQRVTPVLLVDAEIVRRATDRPVLGLIGDNVFERFVVAIDYREEQLSMIPARRD